MLRGRGEGYIYSFQMKKKEHQCFTNMIKEVANTKKGELVPDISKVLKAVD